MDDDRRFMQMALDLAALGAGRTSPNPMVGAVVVKDGRVVGMGYHQQAGGPHAEVLALDEAGGQAVGATLYVTLEPCNHHGRTPPCTKRILAAGIRRVVSAMGDPNPAVAGGGHARLRSAGLIVDEGLLADAAARLNEAWIKYIRTGLPFVVLKCAATLDGCIATGSGDARWITGPAARERVHRLRSQLDAILVGVGTVIADDPQLTSRLPDGSGRDPLRIILDARLETPPESRMLGLDSPAATLIVCAEAADPERRRRLEAAGARLLTAPLKDGRIDLVALMTRLAAMQVTSVLIEGGARVAASALAGRIVDKVMFFYAPKILGGEGVPICRGPGPQRMAEALAVRNLEISRVDGDFLVTGYL
ncbi:MAG: bifunctional diaminohydroxyphosphoribosylaminopyrimidine deaminase/5-amino-6-(5-phosphoribosylamino)uracil reductase RibD [Deltaproteobacteria bacterium]|nr:MAG: bifunctional diaminohydroxyphosphoribosylaminopyrimidine deaminase/5-amino-6-(5-phosphoribosylamino)uracil reductase RibD [Deltaproteobacteria bacterium]